MEVTLSMIIRIMHYRIKMGDYERQKIQIGTYLVWENYGKRLGNIFLYMFPKTSLS